MNIDQPLTLLGGLTPKAFMRQYWQRKPLLIRQAIPGYQPSLTIADIKQLAKRDEVESRLIWRKDSTWKMKQGPFARLPPAKQPGWTLLAQNVDAHDDATANLLHQFRFISDARLDDAMISIATDGGGVGPHFDSYDVFLLQAHGQRRWRISSQKDLTLEPRLPLKILKNFQGEDEYVLEPGDMLYLPPHIAHDGIAQGDCMTISIGFRAPTMAALARGMLDAAGDQVMARIGDESGLYATPPLPGPILTDTYKDAGAPATDSPALLPDTLVEATLKAVGKIQFDQNLANRFLGQWLTEPSGAAWFEPQEEHPDLVAETPATGVFTLDRCTRLMYRGKALFINGEVAKAPASALLQRLANERQLPCTAAVAKRLTPNEKQVLTDWLAEGWLHYTAI